MGNYKTQQEEFWAGNFGNNYVGRNFGEKWVANNIVLFSKALARTKGISSVIEFGANIGLNLSALKFLLPDVDFAAVEINKQAAEELKRKGWIETYCESILNFSIDKKRDLVLTKGVLIHISPTYLSSVYNLLYTASNKYICIAEYYNPSATGIAYRGHKHKLFKRDFAGEMLDRFDNLCLVDYGFVYHRDEFPQDDITWFLMEKE